MNPAFYQKYAFIDYHLRAQLREWQRVKLKFEAKLPNISPTVKPFIIQSLMLLKKRIDDARLKFYNLINYVTINCAMNNLPALKYLLFARPGTGMTYVYETALFTLDSIDVLCEKVNDPDRPISFTKLPYEFQNRLVQLFPPAEVAAFKLTGCTALKYTYKRPAIFSTCLNVVKDSSDYHFVERSKGRKQKFLISSTSCFLQSRCCFVREKLHLHMNSTNKFAHAIKVVSGNYYYLGLEGKYTWKQAVHLMNVSKKVKHVYLFRGMQLNYVDFTEFAAAIVNWLFQQKDATSIVIDCHYFHLSFEGFMKEYIESQTSFLVSVTSNGLVIYQKINFECLSFN